MNTAILAAQQKQSTVAYQHLAEPGQYLTFVLNKEIYAIGILSIKEIIAYEHLTEVPMMPAFVRGVINLRGRVVPVVDLLSRFGNRTTSLAKRTSIVIIEVPDHNDESSTKFMDIGIIVDAVNEVVDITAAMIEPAPSFGAAIRPEFIIGMAKRDHHFIVMLEMNHVLSMGNIGCLGEDFLESNSH